MSLAGLSIDKVHYCYTDEENLQIIDMKIYTSIYSSSSSIYGSRGEM